MLNARCNIFEEAKQENIVLAFSLAVEEFYCDFPKEFHSVMSS